MTWVKPLGRRNQLKDPLRTWRKLWKVVKPIYEGFWHDRDQDIIDRLHQAAKRLKEKRAAQLQDNKEDDTAVPATSNLERSCSLCDEPIGHLVLQCTKETLQDTLKDVTHSTPSWTLDRSPKDCPPISWNWPTNLAAPSPRNSGQLLSEVEFSCQDTHMISGVLVTKRWL